METVNTKINNLNKKFKNNAFVSGIINVLILGLVLVFFSIGFDLTKKLLLDFISLSWASIFPTIVDLLTVAGLILSLRKFSRILKSSDFFLHLDDKEIESTTTENQPKVVEFLNNETFGNLVVVIWSLIGLFAFNFLSNVVLEGINNQFSPLNEWYLLSSNFSHLPIFPINLVSIIVLVSIVLPTALNYAKYKCEIIQISKLEPTKKFNLNLINSQVEDIKTYRFATFVVLSIFCITLSIMQREKEWIFQYNQPISEENVLAEKLNGKASTFCEGNLKFNTLHKQNAITVTVSKTKAFTGDTRTEDYSYAITPELKNTLVAKCR